jgi:hypothetical protein
MLSNVDSFRLRTVALVITGSLLVAPAPAMAAEAAPSPPQAPRSGSSVAAIPGYQVVTAVTVGNSVSPKTATVNCPSGKVVYATGFTVDGPAGRIVADRLVPTSSGVTVTAHETPKGTNEAWWLRAFAVCAASSLPGQEIVSAATGPSPSGQSLTVTCPAGKSLYGSGFAIGGGNGEVIVSKLMPGPSSVTARAEPLSNGSPGAWSLTVYAICAFYLPSLGAVDLLTGLDSANKWVSTTLAEGRVPVGIGWEIQTRSPGQVVISSAMPTVHGSLVSAQEIGDVSASWSLAARTIQILP